MDVKFTLIFLLAMSNLNLYSQKTISKEEAVPTYTLPELLKAEDGKIINSVKEWEQIRRPEILELFENNVYGKTPSWNGKLAYEVISVDSTALEGKAIRKEIRIYLSKDKSKKMDLLIYLPGGVEGPVPVFLGLNFGGNHTIHPDTGIIISQNWTIYTKRLSSDGMPLKRGSQSSRWPVEKILARGYGIATAHCGDLQLDKKDINELPESLHNWFYDDKRVKPVTNNWGTIGIWAWGLSRAMDYLEDDKDVNDKKVAVIGHSRLGKAALWAGAQDERFASIISNNSGEGGAAITRRKFGETIKVINNSFPHWFTAKFKQYGDNEHALPVDFHQLLALIAPRPLYVASASLDLWADPKGEYLSIYHAGPAYELYGKQVFKSEIPPGLDQPLHKGVLGYHNRTGKHNIEAYDWKQYLDFADKVLK